MHQYHDSVTMCARAKPYKPRRVDYQDVIDSFVNNTPCANPNAAIQFARNANFATAKDVVWYDTANGDFVVSQCMPVGARRANSFANFKCDCTKCGGGKGFFYEVNVYTKDVSATSNHHTSTVTGNQFVRDPSVDQAGVSTKGSHW